MNRIDVNPPHHRNATNGHSVLRVLLRSLILVTLFAGCRSSAAGLPPDAKDLGAIWFVGDSITQSNADGDAHGSPRKALHDLLTAAGYTFTYTGHSKANSEGLPKTGQQPGGNLYHYHSGVSGILIGEAPAQSKRRGMTPHLGAFWEQGRIASVKPDTILIMIGSNDTGTAFEVAKAPDRLKLLVQTIYELPQVGTPTVYLATIPPNRRDPSQTANVKTLNAAIPQIVSDFKAEGRDIHFVDQFTPLDADYEANMRRDNLHPNGVGNQTMAKQWFAAIESVSASGPASGATEPRFPGKKGDVYGFDRYDFASDQGDLIVLCPETPAPGNPWIWRSFFWTDKLKPATGRTLRADLKLLEAGFFVVSAGGDRLGHPSGSAQMDAAYDLLTQTYGFAKKPTLVGLSRETLSVYRWASANPEKVACIYIDNGVCSLKSWPGGRRVPGSDAKGKGNPGQWNAMKRKYKFASDAEALAYRSNPVDLLAPLAEFAVPLLHVCGTSDDTVPYEENSAIIKQRYLALGGIYQEVLKPGAGHHPHGMKDPTPILNFIHQHTGVPHPK